MTDKLFIKISIVCVSLIILFGCKANKSNDNQAQVNSHSVSKNIAEENGYVEDEGEFTQSSVSVPVAAKIIFLEEPEDKYNTRKLPIIPWADGCINVLIPENESGKKLFPLLTKNPESAFRFANISPSIIQKMSPKDLLSGQVYFGELYMGRFEYVQLSKLKGTDDFLNKIKNLDIYSIAESKGKIVKELLDIHQQFILEFNNYLDQEFILKPDTIELSESNYNFDSQSIDVDHTRCFLALNDAKELFSDSIGEVGNRKAECIMLLYKKMNRYPLRFDKIPYDYKIGTVRRVIRYLSKTPFSYLYNENYQNGVNHGVKK